MSDPVTAMMAMKVIGTVFSVVGTLKQGSAAQQVGEYNSILLKQKANEEFAIGQRKAQEQSRQFRVLESDALAAAAASGAGASDPTVVNIIANLAGEGAYRAGMEMYSGESQARRYRYAAKQALYEGDAARQQSYWQAGKTIFEAGGSMLSQKYGDASGSVSGSNAIDTEIMRTSPDASGIQGYWPYV